MTILTIFVIALALGFALGYLVRARKKLSSVEFESQAMRLNSVEMRDLTYSLERTFGVSAAPIEASRGEPRRSERDAD